MVGLLRRILNFENGSFDCKVLWMVGEVWMVGDGEWNSVGFIVR